MSSAAEEKFYRATVTKRVDLGPELWILRIRVNGEFKFTPGQYATLGVEGPDRRVERPYSIASAPHEGELEFFLELVPGGDLTPLLFKLDPTNQLLMRKVAKGRFTLDFSHGRKNHLLVCTVTGVAPFVSYVRNLYKEWKESRFAGEHRLFLLNGASRSLEFGYCDELRGFAQDVPWLSYVSTISRPWDNPGWSGEIGRVDDILRKYTDTWGLNGKNSIAYLCGNPDMIVRSKEILMRAGFAKEFLREEFYFPPAKYETKP